MKDAIEIQGKHNTYLVGWEPNCIDNAEIKVCIRRKFLGLIPFNETVYMKRALCTSDEFVVQNWDKFTNAYKKAVGEFEQMIDNRIKVQELRNGQK